MRLTSYRSLSTRSEGTVPCVSIWPASICSRSIWASHRYSGLVRSGVRRVLPTSPLRRSSGVA